MAIASSLDLNSIDNLSRTCRRVREALLQYHSALIAHTLHCENEDVAVDPEDTLRYRARAGNWFYMMDDGAGTGRGGEYSGKSGSCARDMVAECRRCARVVCRVCLKSKSMCLSALCLFQTTTSLPTYLRTCTLVTPCANMGY